MRDKRVPKRAGTTRAGQFAACGWAVVQVAIDEGGGPWNAVCERMPCGCSVQRSITRAEMLALYTAFCKMKGPGGDSYGLFGSGATPEKIQGVFQWTEAQ